MKVGNLGVTLRSNGAYWHAVYDDTSGQEVRKSIGSKARLTRTAAIAVCQDLARRLIVQPGSRDVRDAPTLGAWLDKYLERRALDLAPGTLALHGFTCGFLRAHFGAHIRLDTITRNMAADWADKLAERPGHRKVMRGGEWVVLPAAAATVCCHVRVAKVIFAQAMARDLIPLNPFDRVPANAPQKSKVFYQLKPGDVEALLHHAPDHAWRALIGLCAYAGLRRGEALIQGWDAIRFDEGRLTATEPKDERGRRDEGSVSPTREVKLEPALAALLRECRATYRPGEPLVAPVPTHRHNLWREMRGIIKAAGIDAWSKDPFKTLRDNRATTWRNGYPEHVVDAWMGHSLEVARRHYVAVPDEFYAALATGSRRRAGLKLAS